MSKKTEELVEELSKLSVLEIAELKNALEEKWGVTAMAPAAIAQVAPAADAEETKEQEATDFMVTLEEFPADKKIAVIKVVRAITGLGLKEAKELVESAPKPVKDSAPKAEAEDIKKQLEEAGAKVSFKGL